jgi:uncharacterized protein
MLNNDELELIILPTERCNFRCSYCYETFGHGKIRPELVSGLKAFLNDRLSELKVLKLSWFGGEPLLQSDVVLEVSRFAKEKCRQSGTVFIGAITTNGWFLEGRLLEELVGSGVDSFQVSIDGVAAAHDKTRVMPGASGTFERIYGNLLSARDTDLNFNITIRVHLSRTSIDSIDSLLDLLIADFGGDGRFVIFLKSVEDLGQRDRSTLVEHRQAERTIARLAAAYPENLPMNQPAAGDGHICYAARPNSFVLRSDGRLGKCTVALEDDRNVVGRLLPTGEVEIDAQRMKPWMRGLFSGDAAALACPLSQMEMASH